jgi:hypothetical protein
VASFPQENATLHDLKISTSESKTARMKVHCSLRGSAIFIDSLRFLLAATEAAHRPLEERFE